VHSGELDSQHKLLYNIYLFLYHYISLHRLVIYTNDATALDRFIGPCDLTNHDVNHGQYTRVMMEDHRVDVAELTLNSSALENLESNSPIYRVIPEEVGARVNESHTKLDISYFIALWLIVLICYNTLFYLPPSLAGSMRFTYGYTNLNAFISLISCFFLPLTVSCCLTTINVTKAADTAESNKIQVGLRHGI
jgi:hypothetical protein